MGASKSDQNESPHCVGCLCHQCENSTAELSRKLAITCDDCGAKCCQHIGGPPGYAVVVLAPDAWPADTGDHDRVANMPDEAKRRLCEYIENIEEYQQEPCVWLGEDAKCDFYEWRPHICRAFEPGCAGCRMARQGSVVVDDINGDALAGLPITYQIHQDE